MNDLFDTKLLAGLTLLVVKTSVYLILCSISKLAILNYNIPSQRPISKGIKDTDSSVPRKMTKHQEMLTPVGYAQTFVYLLKIV